MAQVKAADACRRRHRQAFRQRHADLAGAKQLEQLFFYAVVRAGRVAGSGANTLVFLGDQRFQRKLFGGRITPQILANPQVQCFGEGLGQAVGQRLEHDRRIVVMVGLELRFLFLGAQPGGDSEQADIVGDFRVFLACYACCACVSSY